MGMQLIVASHFACFHGQEYQQGNKTRMGWHSYRQNNNELRMKILICKKIKSNKTVI